MKTKLAALLALWLGAGAFAAERKTREFTGSYKDALKKAGPLKTKPKVATTKLDETMATNKYKAAEMNLRVDPKDEAAKLLREITEKFSGIEAADKAKAKLEELSSGKKTR